MKYGYHHEMAGKQYDAIVIGSGIGGLSVAVLLAKANKKVIVLERHYRIGGFSHTFIRHSFEWDVGVHYVGQVHDKKSMLRKSFDFLTDGKLSWSDMGEVYDKVIIENETYEFVKGYENQVQQLARHFPDEEQNLRKYYRLVKKISALSVWFFSERTMPGWLSKTIGWTMRRGFLRYASRTTKDVIGELIQNPKLRAVLCAQYGNYGLPPDKSSFGAHAMIVDHFVDGGNYPVGGSSSINKFMADTLYRHDGILAVRAPVKTILTKDKRVTGVQLENGDRLYAPVVVSNAGVRNTFNRLLDESDETTAQARKINTINPSISHVCLYIGLNGTDAELNLPKHNIWWYKSYSLESDFTSHLESNPSESPVVYISFPSAKDQAWESKHPGTATIQVAGSFPYKKINRWENLPWQHRGPEYESVKKEISDYLLNKLYELVPSVKGKVAWSELSTPLSTKHFTGYSSGEIYGLEHSPGRFLLKNLRPRTHIKNLFLTGQDIVCVGVGGAVFSGIITAISILKRNLIWNITHYRSPEPGINNTKSK